MTDIRSWQGVAIARREVGGYVNATAMCKANGKHLPHYRSNDRTTQYLLALSGSVGIPTHLLIHCTTTGPNELRGTWFHPRLAVDLARWISPEFAVWMDGWFLEAVTPTAAKPAKPEPWPHKLPRWGAPRLPAKMPIVEVPWLLVNDLKALCFQFEQEGGYSTETGHQLIAHAHWLHNWMITNPRKLKST